MRTLILVTVGLGFLLSALPSPAAHAQDGEIARLSSAAYAPDSPVRENTLFQYQTGHYGFAYNCDGEEDKRNKPAICWRKADQCQLPKRMGCFERVRHEVAQVSRRILDGMCDSGCEACQQNRRQSVVPSCSCENCLASQGGETTTGIDSLADATADQTTQSLDLLATEQLDGEQTTVASATPEPRSAIGRRSGLVSVTDLAPATEVELDTDGVLLGAIASPANAVAIQPPVARITSATVGSGVEPIAEELSEDEVAEVAEVSPPSPSTDTHRMSLLERLKKVQAGQAADLAKPEKF